MIERRQSSSSNLASSSNLKVTICSYEERYSESTTIKQAANRFSLPIASKSFKEKLAQCLRTGQVINCMGQLRASEVDPKSVSGMPGGEQVTAPSVAGLSVIPDTKLGQQRTEDLTSDIDHNNNNTVVPSEGIQSSGDSKTAMKASLSMIKSGIQRPLRQIHIVGQLNHSASCGFLFLIGCIVFALTVLVTFVPGGKMHLAEAALVGWPFNKNSAATSQSLKSENKRVVRSQSTSELPTQLGLAGELSQPAAPLPITQQFHYFWNHDKIEPKHMADEANKILTAAQVQTNELALEGPTARGPAKSHTERLDSGKSTTPGEPLDASGSEAKSMGAESSNMNVPAGIQQQLTQLVLQLQRQQQMSMMMQPRFPFASADIPLASRRDSHPLTHALASPFNPMSRFWTSASSPHPVLSPSPFMAIPSEPTPAFTLGFPQQARPVVGSAAIAGVPVFGPFPINPSVQPHYAHAHPIHPLQTTGRSSDTPSKLYSTPAASSRPNLLNRRRVWPLLGLGSGTSLNTAASHVRPTIVQAPSQVQPRVMPTPPVTLNLIPESMAMLDAVSDQLANAIASQLQVRSVQHKLANVISKALSSNQAQALEMLQSASSNPPAQQMARTHGLQIGQKLANLKATSDSPIPPYVFSELLHPAHLGLTIANSLFRPQALNEQSHSNETSLPVDAYGNRLKRRQLSSTPVTSRHSQAQYKLSSGSSDRESISQGGYPMQSDVSIGSWAVSKIMNKDLGDKSRPVGESSKDDNDTDISSKSSLRRLKRSMKTADSGWRSMESPAANSNILKRQADLSNSSVHEEALSNRQDRGLKIKRLTSSASVLHHPMSSRRPALVRGQLISGSAVRVSERNGDSESTSAGPDLMSSSLSESSRVNYFQNVDKEAQKPMTSSTSSTSHNQLSPPVTNAPVLAQSPQDSSNPHQSSPQVPLNVGFSAPTQTGSRVYPQSGSNTTPSNDQQDVKRPVAQTQALSLAPSTSFSKTSQGVTPQNGVKVQNQHRLTQMLHPVAASNLDISSAATGGNYAIANNVGALTSNLGQQVRSFTASVPVLNLVKSGLSQLGTASTTPLEAQRSILNSILNMDGVQGRTSGSFSPINSASTNYVKNHASPSATNQPNSQSSRINEFDLAKQSSGYGDPISTQEVAPVTSNGQDAQNDKFLSYGFDLNNSGAFNHEQSGQNDINTESDGRYGSKNSFNHDASLAENANVELNRYVQQQQQSHQQQQQHLATNEDGRQDNIQVSGINQPDIPETPESNMYSSSGSNQQSSNEHGLAGLNNLSNQPSMSDLAAGLQREQQQQQQVFTSGQLYPSTAQLQALAGAALSKFNQQRYSSQFEENGLRSAPSMQHLYPGTQMYPQTLEQAIRQRNNRNAPPGGYYTVDEEAAAGTAALAGIPSYPTAAQMMALQQGRVHPNDLNSMLMSGSENRESGEEKSTGLKSGNKKGKKKGFKQVSHHYHFNSFTSPFEDPDHQFAPLNPLEIAGSQLPQNDYQQHLKKETKQKSKEEPKQEQEEEEEKPKKKRFLRRFSIKNLFKKLRKEKKEENTETKESTEHSGAE